MANLKKTIKKNIKKNIDRRKKFIYSDNAK